MVFWELVNLTSSDHRFVCIGSNLTIVSRHRYDISSTKPKVYCSDLPPSQLHCQSGVGGQYFRSWHIHHLQWYIINGDCSREWNISHPHSLIQHGAHCEHHSHTVWWHQWGCDCEHYQRSSACIAYMFMIQKLIYNFGGEVNVKCLPTYTHTTFCNA